MPFDIQSARQAGKTDDQIAAYLGSTLGFDVDAAMKAGKTSTQIAEYLSANDRPASTESEKSLKTKQDETPEWAGKYPNLYGMVGAGKEILRTGIEAGGTTLGAAGGSFIPVPGASLVGAGAGYAASKRAANALFGEDVDTSSSGIGKDVAVGGLMQGAGSLIGKIPGVKRILSPEGIGIGAERTVGADSLTKTAETMVEKSLKVLPSVKTGPRETAVRTILEEKIPISKGGLEKTKGLLDDLNAKMESAVADSPNKNNIISIESVLGPVRELRDFLKEAVGGKKMASELDKIVNEFRGQEGSEMTVEMAQTIKQTTNAILKNKAFGSLQNVETETKKQIVRGLKDRIAEEIPEITGLNARYSQLKTLEPFLERAVNRSGNWDLIGLLPVIAGGATGGATGSVLKAAEAGALMKLVKNPQVQSRLAIILHSMGSGSKANIMANTITDTIYNKIAGPQ